MQADAYSVYDAFFKPARGLTEVGCMMHMRRYFFKALDSDQAHMGPAFHRIARLYAVEGRARGLGSEERFQLRQRLSAPVMEKLHAYLLEIREQVLPKSPAARAVRNALNQWGALKYYLEDGDLEIDNGATERANRDIAIGRGNRTFFGSDKGGRTAAVLLSFIAMCKRNAVELSPGSGTCSLALLPTLSTASPSCCRTTGRLSRRILWPRSGESPDLPGACHGASRAAYRSRDTKRSTARSTATRVREHGHARCPRQW